MRPACSPRRPSVRPRSPPGSPSRWRGRRGPERRARTSCSPRRIATGPEARAELRPGRGAGYRDAIAIAAQVREAQRVRNRVLAELSSYTRWMAGLRPYLDEPLNVSRREEEILLIWEKADALARRLERPRIGLLDDLVHEAEELRVLFDNAKRLVPGLPRESPDDRQGRDGPGGDRRCDRGTPWLEPKIRSELLRSFESLAGSEPRPAATRAELRPEEHFDEVRPGIVFRGRLGLKMLGTFDLSAYVNEEKLESLTPAGAGLDRVSPAGPRGPTRPAMTSSGVVSPSPAGRSARG